MGTEKKLDDHCCVKCGECCPTPEALKKHMIEAHAYGEKLNSFGMGLNLGSDSSSDSGRRRLTVDAILGSRRRCDSPVLIRLLGEIVDAQNRYRAKLARQRQ